MYKSGINYFDKNFVIKINYCAVKLMKQFDRITVIIDYTFTFQIKKMKDI